MELAENALIDALLLEGSSKPKRRAANCAPEPPAARTRPRCRCGLCAACVENARWDRIFQEKFADPYYYSPSTVRYGSSLGSF